MTEKKITIETIEEALNRGEGDALEILPDGTVKIREGDEKKPPKVLTKTQPLGDSY